MGVCGWGEQCGWGSVEIWGQSYRQPKQSVWDKCIQGGPSGSWQSGLHNLLVERLINNRTAIRKKDLLNEVPKWALRWANLGISQVDEGKRFRRSPSPPSVSRSAQVPCHQKLFQILSWRYDICGTEIDSKPSISNVPAKIKALKNFWYQTNISTDYPFWRISELSPKSSKYSDSSYRQQMRDYCLKLSKIETLKMLDLQTKSANDSNKLNV